MNTANDADTPPAAVADTFDLGEKLTQRLREHTADRARTQHRIEHGTNQLQLLFKNAPKRPRESRIVLRERVKKLERDRTSRSLPLSQEKALIRQIDAAQKAIRQHDDIEGHQELIRRKKAEIEFAREALRTTNATVSELETALAKVELAKRLGCSVPDLISREVDCPVEKLGRVIGKHGATIKAIEESVGVHIDVDKIHGKIHVRGNESAAEEAVKQLEKLTLAVDEEIEVSADLITYLLTQRSNLLHKIKDDNPNVFIDVLHHSHRIHMRGHPAHIAKAKIDISNVLVCAKTRLLAGKEVATVVGKTGSTINSISDTHSVVMEVNRISSGGDASTLRIIGLSADADAAMAAVDRLLLQNEDVEEVLIVDPMMKNQLLNNSGAGIKEFQNSLNNVITDSSSSDQFVNVGGGVFLVFDRNTAKGAPPSLVIKSTRANIDRAKNLVSKKIDEFNSNITTIDVPPEIVPAIIGKGGARINSLRSERPDAEVDADSTTGKVKIYSHDAATRDAIRAAVEQIVAENQVGSVSIEKAIIGYVLGEPGKEVREKVAEIGCNFNVNDDDTKLIIRGTKEQIGQASELLEAFIAVNHIEEMDIDPDDEQILFAGGSNSILSKMESDHCVKVSYRKGKNQIHVRGELAKVNSAMEDIERFLNGGDGMEVCKFNVPEGAIGSVIGKGGSNISKLEENFEGVRVNVGRDTNIISIRGPTALVKQCRVHIVTTIATSKVSHTIDLSPQQLADMSDSNIIKRTGGITNTSIALNESTIKVRGTSNDVRDAVALLNEHLGLGYVGFIDLEGSQCKRLKTTLGKDSSHLDRIKISSGADITLEASKSTIIIKGKKSGVKKAKVALMGFLDFMFPQQFQTVKVHKTLFKSMGDPGPLANIAVATGASVSLDRDMTWVLINSANSDETTKAVKLVQARLANCEKLNTVLRFETSDSWLLPIIIGKGGSQIQKLQTENACSIDVFKDEVTVVISAETEEAVQAAQVALEALVEQARKECVFIEIPESAVPAFVGKGGSNIKQMAEDNAVDIERVKKHTNLLKITGKEETVADAKTAILSWLKHWEASHVGLSIEIEEQFIPTILGKGGETVRSIQKETGCRIDVDRHQMTLTVREGDEVSRAEAMKKVNTIIEEEKVKAAERAAAREKLRQEQAELAEANSQKAAETSAAAATSDQYQKEAPVVDTGAKKRSSEFTNRPVGSKSIKNKAKVGPTAAIEAGTKRGQELYLMLISGNDNSNHEDQWDCSTVSSSVAMITACDSNNGENDSHYRSISGFTVRI